MADGPQTDLNKPKELRMKTGIGAELLQVRMAKSQNTKKFKKEDRYQWPRLRS